MDGPGFHRHWPQEAKALECTIDPAQSTMEQEQEEALLGQIWQS